jgi:hypothetical protein
MFTFEFVEHADRLDPSTIIGASVASPSVRFEMAKDLSFRLHVVITDCRQWRYCQHPSLKLAEVLPQQRCTGS